MFEDYLAKIAANYTGITWGEHCKTGAVKWAKFWDAAFNPCAVVQCGRKRPRLYKFPSADQRDANIERLESHEARRQLEMRERRQSRAAERAANVAQIEHEYA